MIYNFNLGIGWASSGVEYAQSYRGIVLREADIPAKFIFTDMFPNDHIEHMTKNIYFEDNEIIWLYSFFTDFEMTPVTFTKKQFEDTLPSDNFDFSRKGDVGLYEFKDDNIFYRVYFKSVKSSKVHRVEIVSHGKLLRKDYYTYAKMYSEFYAPDGSKARRYMRRFYNVDGSTAYEEINQEGQDSAIYRFPDRILNSKMELVEYMVEKLHFTKDDYVIFDRTSFVGQAVLRNAGPAKVGVVIHADHYSKGNTNDDYILWNNYYDNIFRLHKYVDFYVVSTDEQKEVLKAQFKKYCNAKPKIITIPVGALDELKYPIKERKPYSVMTASRLATEKHCDYDIKACVKVHEVIPEITLDIYGEGAAKKDLKKLIKELGAQDYIRLMGQYDLTEVYKDYELYLSASTSEGFGLSLLEAIGSGLPIVGFDVPYGNPTFVDRGKNGHLYKFDEKTSEAEKIQALADMMIKYFTKDNRDDYHKHSYEVASKYLKGEVMDKWIKLLK